MQKLLLVGDSKVFQAITLEDFLKSNSLEEDYSDLSGEVLFENLFDTAEKYPDPRNQCVVTTLPDRDEIFEEYEKSFSLETQIVENNQLKVDTDQSVQWWLVHCNGNFYLTNDPSNLLEKENCFYYKSTENINDIDIPFNPRDCHGKKSHLFRNRTEKFWKKELIKKKIRLARKQSLRMRIS